MIVHFVCTGNTYRSRLAEAYCNSLQRPGIRAISSGVEAARNENGPISWYAARLLKRYDLIPFMSPHWTQTTAQLLAASDLVVFLEPEHYMVCRDRFGFCGPAWEVWHIPDLDLTDGVCSDTLFAIDLAGIVATERAFAEIRAHVDRLVDRLTAASALARPPAAGA